jgi:beta-aspartyl-peptidase (threonine type)
MILLVGSSNARVGFDDGIAILRNGGSAIDAVAATIRRVEANPDDHSVGYSGLPNLLGDIELDASIMDGQTLASGAVAALKDHQDAIDLARVVMDTLPHVLIVGDGASLLAAETGMAKKHLLTAEATAIWRSRMAADDADAYGRKMRELAGRMSRDPERPHDDHGTVNVIARDRQGNLASGVSTSGWAWKYPGRVGDSPIIGAGNYADNRWGAAACTGRGEMAQRLCTAHSVVTAMRFGLPLEDALALAMQDLNALDDPYRGEVNIIAVDRHGRPAAASTTPGRTYIAMTEDMESFAELERRHFLPPTTP